MKKIFIYFATAMMLASCSSEESVEDIPLVTEEGLYATLPQVEPLDGITRSTLIYDYVQKKMMFSWQIDDDLGVYAINSNASNSQQLKFVPVTEEDSSKEWYTKPADFSSMTIPFKGPNDIICLTGNTQYLAGKPFMVGHDLDYSKVEVSYLGQTQTAAVAQKYYPGFSGNSNLSDDLKREWQASEKDASAHLGKYDFLASDKVTTNAKGSVNFPMKRLGAICRFYIKCPGEYVYDRLTLVNNDVDFITTGIVDLETKTITPKTTSHSMSVELSLDMTDKANNLSYYNNAGYIIVYMMVGAPLDMSPAEKMAPILYLAAHEYDHPENKHYFKAENMKKPNLTQNAFYQWTIANATDDTPIEFTTIEVQEWVKAMGYYNGEGDDAGKGTQTW